MSNGKNLNSESFAAAFRAALDAYNLKPAQLVEKTGLSTGLISTYLSGKSEPGYSNIQKIAAGFGLTVAQFFAQEPPVIESEPHFLTADEMSERGFFAVPFSTSMKLAAGAGGQIQIDEDEKTSNIIVHGPSLGKHNAKGLQAFRVGGDSMEPVIAKGGIVLADTKQNDIHHIHEGGIYVLCWDLSDGECAVKRLRWADKGKLLSIESEEKFYSPVFKKPREITLIGRVIWGWREF